MFEEYEEEAICSRVTLDWVNEDRAQMAYELANEAHYFMCIRAENLAKQKGISKNDAWSLLYNY